MNLADSILLWSITICLVLVVVQGYPHFPDRIPNGRNIPHPCKETFKWYAIGHENYEGGGVRNVFGEAFAKHGYEWNLCLCEEDSDGDGLTNGEELGDPMCNWKVGDEPMKTEGLSHPGVCNPMGNLLCAGKNDWVDCSLEAEKACAGIEDPGVQKLDLTLPKTKVPGEETTYMCMAFNVTDQLPTGKSHLIATRAIIDNSYVMHHMVVFGCADDTANDLMTKYDKPLKCGMERDFCNDIIAVWSVGANWYCTNQNSGIPMGLGGYKYIVIQYHWNNPELKTDYMDSSGMEFYITPNTRPYDNAVFTIGAVFIQIPPGWPSWEIDGECSEGCTSNAITHPIYITHILPHMHYLGTSLRFEIWRNRTLIYNLYVERYNYEQPDSVVLSDGFQVLAGDYLKVSCTYQSKTRESYTYYGQGTHDEMCYVFLSYYPRLATVAGCIMANGVGYCMSELNINLRNSPEICDFISYTQLMTQYIEPLLLKCDLEGLVCYDECKPIAETILQHQCFTGNASDLIKRSILSETTVQLGGRAQQFLNGLDSCGMKPNPVNGDH